MYKEYIKCLRACLTNLTLDLYLVLLVHLLYAKAERAKFNLDKANLDAQAQNAQKTSLSPELLQKYAIDKWDGKMPQYVGGDSVFNIPLQ
jgi:hypothetical protein